MLKDITFGQYFPGDSIIHRLDPRMKLILIVAYIVLLFVADGLFSLLIGAGMGVIFYALSKLPWKLVIK
ncbi:MAG: energy-coupling factor transporter transmembrane protein EcfT, partial [Oscillospiraceae bacterium]|nr:energy-coupling factor transporter transmembrane protein EcfT [Oscillospiraceae bacterium]